MASSDSVTVIGSIAVDEIETPHGKYENVFGGSATHFACAARFFAPVAVVGCVGEDMPGEFWSALEGSGVDLSAVQRLPGTTFRWGGRYNEDMSVAETYLLDFGVMEDFEPELPQDQKSPAYVFLANAGPALQLRMLEKLGGDSFVVCDTIRHWIENEGEMFREVARRSSGLILNDEEIRLLTGRPNPVDAAEDVLSWGPDFVVVKKAEHGAVLVCSDGIFPLPAYPVRNVTDPTGAGDSFAGGFMATVCDEGTADTNTLKRALAAGIVVSSFNVEGIGPAATLAASKGNVLARLDAFKRLLLV